MVASDLTQNRVLPRVFLRKAGFKCVGGSNCDENENPYPDGEVHIFYEPPKDMGVDEVEWHMEKANELAVYAVHELAQS
jgi:hypothetical protein